MKIEEKERVAATLLGMHGKMISSSKSGYRSRNPKHLVIFNANVCTESDKIWFGDLDITLDKNKLSKLAQELGEDIYVLYEMDGRFENENNPRIEKYIIKYSKHYYKLGESYKYITNDYII